MAPGFWPLGLALAPLNPAPMGLSGVRPLGLARSRARVFLAALLLVPVLLVLPVGLQGWLSDWLGLLSEWRLTVAAIAAAVPRVTADWTASLMQRPWLGLLRAALACRARVVPYATAADMIVTWPLRAAGDSGAGAGARAMTEALLGMLVCCCADCMLLLLLFVAANVPVAAAAGGAVLPGPAAEVWASVRDGILLGALATNRLLSMGGGIKPQASFVLVCPAPPVGLGLTVPAGAMAATAAV
jgi:hypothetical protein